MTFCRNRLAQPECDFCLIKREIVKQTIPARPVIPQPQPVRGEPDPVRWMPSKAEIVLAAVFLCVFVAGMFAGHSGVAPVCEPAHQSRVYQA
ncbi:hypothetical protein DF118_01670 [Burkholderia stagnalis]|nr:hypothetical protein DF163_01530 [Burkholderia stagnalis]RQQ55636.1 hypothetical protein DF162_01665 [Burkholderia stagnalis]RQY19097.1 hypothetical protein DF118_01670 [Burkholderia stagnalis]RQY64218.1 hypothetical protein DF112_00540 [Burkholderia stagnalis]RQY70405.1 hypothetical protein DF109_02360 [Burkholderia stagnalis]